MPLCHSQLGVSSAFIPGVLQPPVPLGGFHAPSPAVLPLPGAGSPPHGTGGQLGAAPLPPAPTNLIRVCRAVGTALAFLACFRDRSNFQIANIAFPAPKLPPKSPAAGSSWHVHPAPPPAGGGRAQDAARPCCAAAAQLKKHKHFKFFIFYFYFPFLTLFLNPSIALLVKLLNHSIYLVRALLRAHFYLGENQTCSWAHNEIV